jgi:hypothetical protein
MELTDVNFTGFIIVDFGENLLDFFILLNLLSCFKVLGLSSTSVSLFEPIYGVIGAQNIAFAWAMTGSSGFFRRLGMRISWSFDTMLFKVIVEFL